MTTMRIRYLSRPAPVSMSHAWFDVSSLSHFWIRRRCEVLRSAMFAASTSKGPVAEIGCGNGLLQLQLEELLETPVDGFDLNEEALRQNNVKRGNLYCYDIHQRDVSLKEQYGTVFLFDVLEHNRAAAMLHQVRRGCRRFDDRSIGCQVSVEYGNTCFGFERLIDRANDFAVPAWRVRNVLTHGLAVDRQSVAIE